MKKFVLLGLNIGAALLAYNYIKLVKKSKDKTIYRYRVESDILYQWLAYKQKGKSIIDFFRNNNIKTVAIYGMGEMGCRLYEELKDSDVKVRCAIDQMGVSSYDELETIDNDELIPEVDAIIISVMFAYDSVKKMLAKKTSSKIISIEDVVYGE